MEYSSYNQRSLRINPKYPKLSENPILDFKKFHFGIVVYAFASTQHDWQCLRKRVLRLCEQTPTEATVIFVCSQDQNIRLKMESHIRKITEVPWNLEFVISEFRKRSVRALSSICKASKNAFHCQIQKLNGSIWKFPFLVYGNKDVSCAHSWSLWEVLEALTLYLCIVTE